MNYSDTDIKLISNNQLSSRYYQRALVALNELASILSKDWVEKEIADFITEKYLIEQLGKDRIYRGINDLEKMVFLWEDLELLKKIKGFGEVLKKLKSGLRFENIDLEISIASDIIRCNALLELEPLVGNGNKKADCKFKIGDSQFWTFVEITRKQNSTTQKLIETRGAKLSELVSLVNPERRCVLVVKKELDEAEYNRVCEWLKSNPKEGEFENFVVFFSVPHNVDDTEQAFKHAKTPISIRQGSGEKFGKAFGVVYLHIPDYGAEKKLANKREQLPNNEQGILFIDLTGIAGGFVDWRKQINFTENLEHFSAVILLRDSISSDGYTREIEIIRNENSKNPLTESVSKLIENIANVRKNKNLMGE
jgi:hypothetical protein